MMTGKFTGVRGANHEYCWHVGQQFQYDLNTSVPGTQIITVDGDELDFIRAKFSNLKDCAFARVVVYKGEDADFIFQHMLQYRPKR